MLHEVAASDLLRANTKVTAVASREITLSDGNSITSFTLVWTAGSSPHPLLDQLNLPKEHGRIKVNANLEVAGMQGTHKFSAVPTNC